MSPLPPLAPKVRQAVSPAGPLLTFDESARNGGALSATFVGWAPAVMLDATLVRSERERAICLRYASRIRAYGLCHLRDGAGAQDLEQHVLLAVLQAVRDGRVDEGRLDAYVAATCRNA